jgi:uncharacterized membrane protein
VNNLGDISLVQNIRKVALGFFLIGLGIAISGVVLESLRIVKTAWPSIVLGLLCIATSVLLDNYRGSRFG